MTFITPSCYEEGNRLIGDSNRVEQKNNKEINTEINMLTFTPNIRYIVEKPQITRCVESEWNLDTCRLRSQRWCEKKCF